MSKRDLIISTIVVLVFVIGVGIGVYYFVSYNNFVTNSVVVSKEDIEKRAQKAKLKKQQAELEQIKKDFPDVIIGVITLSDQKTTIKTDDGKEWVIWPPRPKSLYEYEGIKDGQKVELRGKILDEERIQWRQIKPI